MAYNSLRKKVAYGMVQLLSNFKENGKKSITLKLSRKELAQAVGVATESLVRTITDFREEKMIDIVDGQIFPLSIENKLRNLPN